MALQLQKDLKTASNGIEIKLISYYNVMAIYRLKCENTE